jgi:membrane protein insertase Oxa1/YidC/SpoIIIJ
LFCPPVFFVFFFFFFLPLSAIVIYSQNSDLLVVCKQEEIHIGIVHNLRKINIEDIVGSKISHHRHKAQLPRPGGAVQEKAPLPNAAKSVIILFGFEEGFKVGLHLVF